MRETRRSISRSEKNFSGVTSLNLGAALCGGAGCCTCVRAHVHDFLSSSWRKVSFISKGVKAAARWLSWQPMCDRCRDSAPCWAAHLSAATYTKCVFFPQCWLCHVESLRMRPSEANDIHFIHRVSSPFHHCCFQFFSSDVCAECSRCS